MKNKSLKFRIVIVALLPFLFFTGLALFNLSEGFNQYLHSVELTDDIQVIQNSSFLVHELQKERGKSASYLSGGASIDSLSQQRLSTEVKMNEFVSLLNEMGTKRVGFHNDIESELKQLRESVTNKSLSVSETVSKYTDLVKALLKINITYSETTDFFGNESKLKTLYIFESIKENTGKLRAGLVSVLAQEKPIDKDKFNFLHSLKRDVNFSLNSEAIIASSEVMELKSKFSQSKEWIFVEQTVQTVNEKKKVGDFGINSEQFFKTITVSVNDLHAIVNRQIKDINDNIQNNREAHNKNILTLSGLFVFSLLFLSFFTFMTINSLLVPLKEIFRLVSQNSEDISLVSDQLLTGSREISDSSSRQAASVQETVASVDEINAMVNKNTESAQRSEEISEESQSEAENGKKIIEEMAQSIYEISASNDNLMNQMESTNNEIKNIVNVIGEIGEKTKVINDIVFQTKLLSFNASVEAARAGEHGKGFSVVAEEVGNLAQMSGNASQEISGLLDESTKKVTEIVNKSQVRLKELIDEGNKKVEMGTSTAERCGVALDNIVEKASKVTLMVKEISTASQEQSIGIQEINRVMSEMDQVTQQNARLARETSSHSENLLSYVFGLNNIKETLERIMGEKSINSSFGKDGTSKGVKKEVGKKSSSQKIKLKTKLKSKGHTVSQKKSGLNLKKEARPTKVKKTDSVVQVDFKTPNKKIETKKTASQKVANHDFQVPSANDPRFEDF